MSDIAVRVEHLSKLYRLGEQRARYSTFRETLAGAASAPLRWLKGERRAEPNTIWALDDVSFEVKHGEAVGIIGRNGAGKSTLLKVLSRITKPTRGRVDIYGRVGSLLEVGTGFHPELTGRENIYLNGAILGMSRREIQRKFDEIVDFAEIEKFLDTPVKFYSSGMYVRLAFAVAAHLEPEILVVDEVLAVGDAEFQKKCLGKMGDVAQEGRTVLFVSHNMAAVRNLCLNGLLLSDGAIQIRGKISEIISHYLNSSHGQDLNKFFLESEEIRLVSLKIFQENYNNQIFMTDHPLNIEYEYEIKKKVINGLRIGFDLITPESVIVFRTFDDDLINHSVRKQGLYKSICTIPPNFFLGSDYYILPRIGIHNNKWISDNDTRIKITFDHILGVNQNYADHRPGIIMPALKWNTH